MVTPPFVTLLGTVSSRNPVPSTPSLIEHRPRETPSHGVRLRIEIYLAFPLISHPLRPPKYSGKYHSLFVTLAHAHCGNQTLFRDCQFYVEAKRLEKIAATILARPRLSMSCDIIERRGKVRFSITCCS